MNDYIQILVLIESNSTLRKKSFKKSRCCYVFLKLNTSVIKQCLRKRFNTIGLFWGPLQARGPPRPLIPL